MTPSVSRWPALAPLAQPSFRHLWLGTIFTQILRWMDQTGQGWLMYQLTGSPLWLGLSAAARGVPQLVFSAPGGVLVDRLDAWKIILAGQAGLMLLSLAQAILILTGSILPWHLLAAGFGSGLVVAVLFPARQSVIPRVTQREYLGNAVAVNSAGQNACRVLGPSLAGLIIGAVGIGGSFCVQSAAGLFALWSTARLRLEPRPKNAGSGSPLQEMLEGMRYAWASPKLRPQMQLAVIPSLLAIPFVQLMPVFAKDILHVGPEGLGLLLAVNGVGAVVGAVLLASFNPDRRGMLLVLSAGALGILVTLFAFSSDLVLSVALCGLIGVAHAIYLATNNTLIHMTSPEYMRGRILALYMTSFSLVPLGSLPQSALASVVGAPLAVGLSGVLCVGFVVAIALRSPTLRQL